MASEYASWESEPRSRGTWSILSSCIITLVLCVYTAVHLNVPAASETRSQRYQYIVGWVLLGVFAPEIVAWTAWCQWREAKSLTREMHDMKQSLADPEKSVNKYSYDLSELAPLINSWTLKHSYFIIMGGIQLRPIDAVHYPDLDKRWFHSFLPHHGLPQSILSVTEFRKLLEYGHGKKIPVLTEGDIDDRSKADGLAKVLSCLQGSWILIQIIGRVSSRLAVTELEVNTLAHVICTIAMYMFWWNKPLKVEQPIFLDTTEIESWTLICSGLQKQHRKWLSRDGGTLLFGRSLEPDHTTRLSHDLHAHTKTQGDSSCERCPNHGSSTTLNRGLMLRPDVSISADEVVRMLNTMSGTPFCDFVAPIDKKYKPSWRRPQQLSVSQSELEFLLKMQTELLENWNPEWLLQEYGESEFEFEKSPSMIKFEYLDQLDAFAVTVLLSSLYGALHASLWHHHFPTTFEMWMWRVSCIVVAGTGLVFAVAFVPVESNEPLLAKITDYIDNHLYGKLSDIKFYILVPGGCIMACVSIFCRLFLFVEAFISLRSQPRSVYQTPEWSQWLPHL